MKPCTGPMCWIVATLLAVSSLLASTQAPLDRVEVLGLLLTETPSGPISYQVTRSGITSKPDGEFVRALRTAGATEQLIDALRSARKRKPKGVGGSSESQEQQVVSHLSRAATFKESRQWAQRLMKNSRRFRFPYIPRHRIMRTRAASFLQTQNSNLVCTTGK